MDTCHVRTTLDTTVAAFETRFCSRLEHADLAPHLAQAVRHAATGGKRLRPALLLLSCDAVGGARDRAWTPAIALELIHGFSLVHDDLPALDDDELRRGRPTTHVQFGEAMGVLAGDAMLALAFREVADDKSLGPALQAQMYAELARATVAMIEGQVYDTLDGVPEGLTPEQELHLVHQKKTGALIRAATRAGGLAGGGTAAQLDALTRYGEAIGLMFQIVDDVLDVTQSTEQLGKAAGKDVSAGKRTYPGRLGLERSRSEIDALRSAAHDALVDLGAAAQPLADLADHLAVRTR